MTASSMSGSAADADSTSIRLPGTCPAMRLIATVPGSPGMLTSIATTSGRSRRTAATAPPALLIALAAHRVRVRPSASSWPTLGSGLALLTLSATLRLVDRPEHPSRLAGALLLGSTVVLGAPRGRCSRRRGIGTARVWSRR